MKTNNLLKLASLFNIKLIKESSLTTDMANRIMYSVIQGIVRGDDIKILQLSVAGAPKLIKYGTSACLNETRHAKRYSKIKIEDLNPIIESKDNEKIIIKDVTKENINQIIDIQNKVLDIFQNAGFLPYYSGRGWINIIKILINLTTSYKKYLESSSEEPNYLNNMKRIIMLMNVFDGTAHNTGSIYSKLISLEVKAEKHDPDLLADLEGTSIGTKRLENLEKMMDAKELHNERDVFDIAFKSLDRIAPYAEYLHKVRDKDYFSRKDTKIEIFRIKAKKLMLAEFSTVITDIISRVYEAVDCGEKITLYMIRHSITYNASNSRDDTLSILREYAYLNNLRSEMPMISSYGAEITAYCISLHEQIYEAINALPIPEDGDSQDRAFKFKNICETALLPYEAKIKDKITELFGSMVEAEAGMGDDDELF